MKLVSSVLRLNGDDRSRVAPKFCIEVTGENSKFLSCIDVGCGRATSDARYVSIVVINAINHEVVVALTLAINTEASESCLCLSCTRREKNQSIWIAAQQRKIHDLLVIKQCRQLLIGVVDLSLYIARRNSDICGRTTNGQR